ncbi:unnamed protein product [Effrenium voratum]|nr:unnamed protein product [Effrenium voratum]
MRSGLRPHERDAQGCPIGCDTAHRAPGEQRLRGHGERLLLFGLPFEGDVDVRPIAPKLRDYFEPRLGAGVAVSFQTIVDGLTNVVFKNYKFTVPAFYALVVRSLVTLEGLALTIDPKYRVLAAAYPYVARRILLDAELRSSLFELLFNSEGQESRFRWDRAVDLLRESSKSTVAVPGSRPGQADDTALLMDLASSLIEDVAFRRTLVAELATTADVLIADMIGGAVGDAKLRERLGLRLDDQARLEEIRETVNLLAEKVAGRVRSMDAIGMVQAAAGAVQGMWPEDEDEKGARLPTVAGEFLDQLRQSLSLAWGKGLGRACGRADPEGTGQLDRRRRDAPASVGKR